MLGVQRDVTVHHLTFDRYAWLLPLAVQVGLHPGRKGPLSASPVAGSGPFAPSNEAGDSNAAEHHRPMQGA